MHLRFAFPTLLSDPIPNNLPDATSLYHQENNAVAKMAIKDCEVKRIYPLGYKVGHVLLAGRVFTRSATRWAVFGYPAAPRPSRAQHMNRLLGSPCKNAETVEEKP